jgi:hypothetical protein
MALRPLRGFVAALLVAVAGVAGAADAGPDSAESMLGEDFFSAGPTVVLERPITGDALMAGGSVESNASIGGDATMAGAEVSVRATVGDDLYAAGGQVDVDALVAGNARLAGGRVRVAPESRVEGGVAIAGGRVDVRGTFARYLTVAGGDVTVGGDVRGDLRVYADTLTVLPGTTIGGRLIYRVDGEPVLPADLVVGGGTERAEDEPDARSGGGLTAAGSAGWLWLAGLVAVGLLLAYGLGRLSTAASQALAARPWFGMGVGFAVLVCVPAAAGLLFVTVIGIPLALIVVLVYLAMLIAGYVVGALFLGDRALARLRGGAAPTPGWRLVALVAVLVVVGWVAEVPVVGNLARLAVLLLGLGGLALAWRAAPAVAVAPHSPPAHPPSVV